MFVASSTNVNSNPKTQAAIQAQRAKLLPPPPTEEEKAAAMALAIERDRGPHTLRYIARQICKSHLVAEGELRGNSRYKDVVLARQAFSYWCRELVGCSYPVIAKYLNRDHTTVMHSAEIYPESRRKNRHKRRRRPIVKGD